MFLSLIYLVRSYSRICQFLNIVKFSKSIKFPGLKSMLEHLKTQDTIKWLTELQLKYNSTFGIWLGTDFTVFIADPEDVQIVLGSNRLLYKSMSYIHLEPWLGRGLLTNGGELWHRKRKMLTPGFHFKRFSEFKQSIYDNCNIMIDKLKEKSNGEPFDIYPFVTLLTLDIICETAMGIKQNAQLQNSSEYVKAVETMCRIIEMQMFSIWKKNKFLFKFTEDFELRKQTLEILHGQTNRVIELRKRAFKDLNINSLVNAEKSNENGVKKRLAFLDILLLAQMEGANLSDTDIREEVDTFMFEGHDTTSSALSFTIFLLSQHKAEQEKAFEESIAFEGKENENMKYLEAVIKEALRLYPSVPFYSRQVLEEIQLRHIKLPKGVNVAVMAYLMHRDGRYFPEPNRFNPERFLVEPNSSCPYAFVPFSAGPRNCIGQKFAMLEVKCVLANLLRAYEFLPVEGFVPHPVAETVLKSRNGIQVRLRKR